VSQKTEILAKLREEGERGVSGKWFYEHFQGRGVARIWDLRHKDGYEIEDHPDPKDPKYKIYVLRNVGSSTEGRDQAEPRTYQPVDAISGVASGVEASVSTSSPPSGDDMTGSARLNPYEAEVWAD